MPYLNLKDYDQYVHLVQLFLAAHPEHQKPTQAGRQQTGLTDQYFLSLEMIQAMAVWGKERHLITRKAAARMVEVAAWSFAKPEDIVTLVPAVLGDPPRLQPTVLDSQMLHWVTSARPPLTEHDEVRAFTIPAAITLLHAMTRDAEFNAGQQARARELIAWLEAQAEA
jgi:hypothetical protein